MYKLSYFKVEGLPSIGPQEMFLPVDSSIYFVMGANGTGKTTMLNILNSCFQQDWEKLSEIEFIRVTFSFSNQDGKKDFVIIHRDTGLFVASLLDIDTECLIPNKSSAESKKFNEYLILKGIEFKLISRLSCGHWKAVSSPDADSSSYRHMRTEKTVVDYLLKFQPIKDLCNSNIEKSGSDVFSDFLNILIQENIFFISTDRMQKIPKDRFTNRQIMLKDLGKYVTSKINIDIKEMESEISLAYSRYNDFVKNRQLELINNLQKNNEIIERDKDVENSMRTYQEYQKNIMCFEQIGINPDTIIDSPNENSPYLPITSQLLEIFNLSYKNNFNEKMKYFIAFFSFLKKAIPTKNFSFRNNKMFISSRQNPEIEIQPENLSSGEQQLVILGYEILSSCNTNSLVLIDEPEISMDPAMKSEFVDFLYEAAELRDSRYLLATHSHMVIGDKRDEVQILRWEGNIND